MRGTIPAPELPPSPRSALVIATATYADQDLSQLRAPVHLSCHGLLDARDRLCFAATGTDKAVLSATAVESTWLAERLEECRSDPAI